MITFCEKIDTMNSVKCKNFQCRSKAKFGLSIDSPPIFCGKHCAYQIDLGCPYNSQDGTKQNRFCSEGNCLRMKNYKETTLANAKHCNIHKNLQRLTNSLCKVCGEKAIYGSNKKLIYCEKHATTETSIPRSKLCEFYGCANIKYYNYLTSRDDPYCWGHRCNQRELLSERQKMLKSLLDKNDLEYVINIVAHNCFYFIHPYCRIIIDTDNQFTHDDIYALADYYDYYQPIVFINYFAGISNFDIVFIYVHLLDIKLTEKIYYMEISDDSFNIISLKNSHKS